MFLICFVIFSKVRPRVGWQLDPFGHSAMQQSLFSSECGMSSLFFGRIDSQDLTLRQQNQSCEFIWDSSTSFGKESAVLAGLTGSYEGNYQPPGWTGKRLYDWDSGIATPIIDDARLSTYNLPDFINNTIINAQIQAGQTRGNTIMWTFGTDFTYSNAWSWFSNMDKLIHYMNKDGRINIVYSNPEEYASAKAAEWKEATKEEPYPSKQDDFFPYADVFAGFWTGFFTSRPALKRYVREVSGWYQAIKRIDALAFAHDDENTGLGSWVWEFQSPRALLADAMGMAQHHDAVSGTEKQAVAFDYAMRIHKAVTNAYSAVTSAISKLVSLPEGTNVVQCPLANVSICEPTKAIKDGGSSPFLVWNSLAQESNQFVDMPVYNKNMKLVDGSGKEVETTISSALPARHQYGTDVNSDAAGYNLRFRASVPALSFAKYKLLATQCKNCIIIKREKKVLRGDITLENDFLKVTFANGGLASIKNKKENIGIDINQNFYQYLSCARQSGVEQCKGQNDGAYIFRPANNTPSLVYNDDSKLEQVGKYEVRQSFGSNKAIQAFKLVDSYLEVTWTVGPIEAGDEVITRFDTSINSNNEAWTDSNGLEMQYRKFNYRPTWDLKQTQAVAGNYFPLNAGMFIRDKKAQLTLLVDRAQGGTGVLEDGQMEVMLHRASILDDSRGVGEKLFEVNDKDEGLVVRGKTYLVLSAPEKSSYAWRPLADQIYMPNQIFFLHGGKSHEKKHFDAIQEKQVFLKKSMPSEYQIVSLERLGPHSMIRIMLHNLDTEDQLRHHKVEPLQLQGLFKEDFFNDKYHKIIEVSATANQLRIKMEQYRQKFPWSQTTSANNFTEWQYGDPCVYSNSSLKK